MKILVVDDNATARTLLARVTRGLGGVEVEVADALESARKALAEKAYAVAFIDLRLDASPDNRDGLTLVREALKLGTTPVIVSGFSDMTEIRAAMRSGAYDYLIKEELSSELVWPLLETIRSRRALEAEVSTLRSKTRVIPKIPELIGSSEAMQKLSERIARVALSDRPVLVTGPTGSGKELVVRAIHNLGQSPSSPVIDLNCGALPENLIESQLYGHVKGAFTGADSKHEGFFTTVGDGTLFLDEIGELPYGLQSKLLRVLESRSFRAVGGKERHNFKGRVVAATHVNLPKRVKEQTFREDLYYRLNVLELVVPSLAERREDIPDLVAHFCQSQGQPLHFTDKAITLLKEAPWPGNVRQLRNAIDRIAVFAPTASADSSSGLVDEKVVADILQFAQSEIKNMDSVRLLARRIIAAKKSGENDGENEDTLKLMEGALVSEALDIADGNKTAAARLLGVHRKVVERRMLSDSSSSDSLKS